MLCERYWGRDGECPNKAEFIVRNINNPGYAVMCRMHKFLFLRAHPLAPVTVERYEPQWEQVCIEV